MKAIKRISAGFVMVVLLAAATVPVFAQGIDFARLLSQIVPEADRFSQLSQTVSYKSRSLTQAIFPAYRADKQIGVVFYAAPEGYSGLLHTLVSLDMEGTVRQVKVFSHTETPAWVVPLNDGSFLRQFDGITLLHKLSLLIGQRSTQKGEIAAITSSTITSKPIAVAVSEARKLFVEIYKP